MHWLEALEQYLNAHVRCVKYHSGVVSATVETCAPPAWLAGESIGGWAFEERPTSCGMIALHLFPSAS